MNIDIIGGGSIGLLFAAKLAMAGEQVTVWTRTEAQARLLNESGIRLEANGQTATAAVHARYLDGATAADRSGGEPRTILLTVKQPDITDKLMDKLAILAQGTDMLLVCLQNGIGHIERLSECLPLANVLAAVTTDGARRQGYGTVEHTGIGELWIGEARLMEGSRASSVIVEKRQKMFLDSLKSAGFRAYLSNNINNRIFQKLLINAVINPLTAIYDVRNGELPQHPFRLRLMQALCKETLDVLAAAGYRQEDGWEKVLSVCEATAANISSMLSDVREGRTTEIAWINGGVVQLAGKHGLRAPLNEGITEIVLGLASTEFSDRTEP